MEAVRLLRIVLCVGGGLCLSVVHASQWGPVFPSHRYPTDRSFHFNGAISYGSQSSGYDSEGSKTDLGEILTRYRLLLNPEYQPSRQFSLGAYLNFDALRLSGDGEEVSKSGFADQHFFGEFRLIDESGYSLGFGTLFKIPFYSVPKDVNTSERFLLLGDGQIDASLYVTSEYWIHKKYKIMCDVGLTFRTDDHASEIPLQIGIEYASPEFNFGLYGLGNFSFNNDKATQTLSSLQIQNLTGNTGYVFATNPQIALLEIRSEYAFNFAWAVVGSARYTLWGRNAPHYFNIGVGISYRVFDPYQAPRRAREVGIETDDSSSEFDGEIQERFQDEPLQRK